MKQKYGFYLLTGVLTLSLGLSACTSAGSAGGGSAENTAVSEPDAAATERAAEPKMKGLEILTDENTAAPGEQFELNAAALLNPGSVIWTSTDETVATVDENGRVTANGPGTVKISAELAGNPDIAAEMTLTVEEKKAEELKTSEETEANGERDAAAGTEAPGTEGVLVAALKPAKSEILLFEGQSTGVEVEILPEDAETKALSWSSSDEAVAAVDENGLIQAVSAGSSDITAEAVDGSGKSCSVELTVEPLVPLTMEKVAFGIQNGDLLALTVRNRCKTQTIKNFDFDFELYNSLGKQLDTGSKSLGTEETIAPDSTLVITRELPGAAQCDRIVITITGVQLSDGSFYEIPYYDQEIWTFSR